MNGKKTLTLNYKVLFMATETRPVEALQDIHRLMQRSTRFISLSGLSGIAVGCWAIVGAYFAYDWIYEWKVNPAFEVERLVLNLMLLAAAVFAGSVVTAFYFTWRRARKNNETLFDRASRQLAWNIALPMFTGGLFILGLINYNLWVLVAPSSLVFYGLALVNGSKYTLSEIRLLGITEIALGIVSMFLLPGYGILVWAIGFGALHILYGGIMWWRYERNDD